MALLEFFKNLNPVASAIIALLFAFMAYAKGRNPVIWFLGAYMQPIFAAVVFILRIGSKPKESPPWVKDLVLRFKSRNWSRKIKPEDFNDQL